VEHVLYDTDDRFLKLLLKDMELPSSVELLDVLVATFFSHYTAGFSGSGLV
jgi:hypothetical protein